MQQYKIYTMILNKFKTYINQYKQINLLVVFITMFTPYLISQNISTVKEIYNFQIGDIFHFDFYGSGPGYGESSITNIMITDLYYSQNNDTIFYIRKIDREVNSSEYPETKYEHYSDTVFYTNLASLINNGQIDSVYSDTNLYFGRKINDYHFSAFEDYTKSSMYVEGCGITETKYSNWDSSVSSDDKLLYYKKGDEEWGVPHPVSVNEIETSSLEINVYPVPSDNYVNIFSKDLTNGSVTITSLTGEKIMLRNVNSNLTTVDISKLPAGAYLLFIENGDRKTYRKLIKK